MTWRDISDWWREQRFYLGPWAYVGPVIAMVMVWGVFMVARKVTLQPTCLRAGYPGVSITWSGEGYCVKRVDQTDVVTPIEQLR